MSRTGSDRPPVSRRNRIALRSQASSQARQVTPFTERQESAIAARHGQLAMASSARAPVGQACAHAPQNVHAPRETSTDGPSGPLDTIPSGQASAQCPQPSQSFAKTATAPGGRITVTSASRNRPLRKFLRLCPVAMKLPGYGCRDFGGSRKSGARDRNTVHRRARNSSSHNALTLHLIFIKRKTVSGL